MFGLKKSISVCLIVLIAILSFSQEAEARRIRIDRKMLRQIGEKFCTYGGCQTLFEETIDVFQENQNSSSSSQQSQECLSQGKGCYTIRTGGQWEYVKTITRKRMIRTPN